MEIKNLKAGSNIKLDDYELTILDSTYPVSDPNSCVDTGVFCISNKSIFINNIPFDSPDPIPQRFCEFMMPIPDDIAPIECDYPCNYWIASSLRASLRKQFWDSECWYKSPEHSKIFQGILPFKRSLDTVTKLTAFDSCIEYISLISYAEYSKYKQYIPKKNHNWWTLTPFDTDHTVVVIDKNGEVKQCFAGFESAFVYPVFVLSGLTDVEVLKGHS